MSLEWKDFTKLLSGLSRRQPKKKGGRGYTKSPYSAKKSPQLGCTPARRNRRKRKPDKRHR